MINGKNAAEVELHQLTLKTLFRTVECGAERARWGHMLICTCSFLPWRLVLRVGLTPGGRRLLSWGGGG